MSVCSVASETLAERFWAKVPVEEGGCWEWLGGRDLAGYGRIRLGPKARGEAKAHRVAWEITHGTIPDGMCVCHRCDNPPCVRPNHLFLGTIGDNNRDMHAKGRATRRRARGADHGNAVLTESLVLELRARKANGETFDSLAATTKINRATIVAAVSGHNWAWLK